jgi:F-type H+-transporting ATPase subunit a
MFAGHLLLILFALGGEFLVLHGSALVKPVGVLTWLLFLAIAGLELLVQFLQAFIFTILTSLYISSAIAEEH